MLMNRRRRSSERWSTRLITPSSVGGVAAGSGAGGGGVVTGRRSTVPVRGGSRVSAISGRVPDAGQGLGHATAGEAGREREAQARSSTGSAGVPSGAGSALRLLGATWSDSVLGAGATGATGAGAGATAAACATGAAGADGDVARFAVSWMSEEAFRN